MNQSDLITPTEAAQILCSTVKTLGKYRCTGEHSIPYRKLGNKVLYSRSDLDAYMNASSRSFNKIEG